MPREHANIKMDPEELRAFLASDSRCIVATVTEDGSPWADAAACCFVNDRLYFRVPVHTRTYRHLHHDDRVCCVIESKPTGSSYYDIKGAMLHGPAQPLGDGEAGEVASIMAALPDPVEPERAANGAIYSVGLEDSTSFSFQKIRYRYEDRALS